MALKTLSTFLAPLPLQNPKSRTLILFQFPKSRSLKARLSAEPDGTGAAAPSPGERFLEHHHAAEAAKLIVKENKKNKIKKNKEKPLKASRNVASCYGCGAPLQTSDEEAPGYVNLETYELKKKHRQLRTVLCRRCRLLSHGKMITAVGGHGGYNGGKLFVTAEELREKLSHLRHEKALIVKLLFIPCA
ncbi:hypothetical protein PIB30_055499 [Stylosanthes scabra]|uniref:Uncharacterized protein n=1 Tax=Stylosanthes scabra TaxID=79078 RepID=A0ABU6VM77_9FABA|nr:hypothetical protein [Stylosanthes scabra]